MTNDEKEEDMRIYNFSITYDSYYHVPRIWFFGVDEDQKPLTKEQMFEDVMPEYRDETVRIFYHFILITEKKQKRMPFSKPENAWMHRINKENKI